MKIIDTYSEICTAYEGAEFSFERWKAYIDAALPGIAHKMVSNVQKSLNTGRFSWEKDYLPVLNAAAAEEAAREAAHASFCSVTKDLERTVLSRFGKGLDVDVIFYLGLCNAAGWVTQYQERRVILLGIEKIIELNWCGIDDMRGLIYHELGHIYQEQYGILKRECGSDADSMLWQLFTEGVAMCFEQELAGDPDYYHQDKDGWKGWCDTHWEEIKADFKSDLKTMSFANQRYFGDWVSYRGHGDVGYYLGCRFVRDILRAQAWEEVIRLDIDTVKRLFLQFAA